MFRGHRGAVVAALLPQLVFAQDLPLLSTIATLPDVSNFSSVITSTGGPELNPALEERFNSVLDGRKFTALAPTNEAFARISPPLVDALTAAAAYPILEAVIRSHIAEGLVTSADVLSASPIKAVEGVRLTAVETGDDTIIVNGQAKIVAVDALAANGVVHQIDQVLNFFTAILGISEATDAAPNTTTSTRTMADILRNEERLSTIVEALDTLNPDFVANRLDLAREDDLPQIFAAPSNDAFAGLRSGSVALAVAPSNQPLSLQLFSFGLLSNNAPLSAIDFSAGPVSVSSASTEIGATLTQTDEGAVFLNNAAIQEEICGSNGCVWIVDRIIDPLYLAFGPLDRTS